jgi:hypothetical protein
MTTRRAARLAALLVPALLAPAAIAFPALERPVEHALNQGALLGNDFDDDPAAGSAQDSAAPNPFVESTRIEASIPGGGARSLTILDVAGRVVRRLDLGAPTGFHAASAAWDGFDDAGARVPAGVYFLRVEGAAAAASGRVLRLR